MTDAAQRLGVPRTTLDSWERGARTPAASDIDMLAKHYRLPPVQVAALLSDIADKERARTSTTPTKEPTP